MAEWTKAADCKSVGEAYEGSNPSLPILGRNNSIGRVFRFRAGVTQLVEYQPSKLRVAGSSPVSRSKIGMVAGSSPVQIKSQLLLKTIGFKT